MTNPRPETGVESQREASGRSPAEAGSAVRHHRLGTLLAGGEAVAVAVAVVLDVFVPTLVVLALATVLLLIQREGPSTLGFTRLVRPWRSAAQVLALTVVWTLLQLALFMPIGEHLSGEKQDVSQFEDLEGNLGMLLGLLALSWVLAALGEEFVYRGYFFTRITNVFGTQTAGLAVAVVASSVLFGLAHTEQGLMGVLVTSLDALFLSALRLRYRTVWAPVLAHGFNNTIGFVAFYLVGPIHGLW